MARKQSSVTLEPEIYDMLDTIVENNPNFEFRNEVIEAAVREYYNSTDGKGSVGFKLDTGSVYILTVADKKVEYLVVEDGELVKKTKTL